MVAAIFTKKYAYSYTAGTTITIYHQCYIVIVVVTILFLISNI